jgi:hypothetical protein
MTPSVAVRGCTPGTDNHVVCATEQTMFGVADILTAYPPVGGAFWIRAGASELMPGKQWQWTKEQVMGLGTILLIILILMLVGVLPTWPHARSWGYGPSGLVGVILVIVLVLFLMGRL